MTPRSSFLSLLLILFYFSIFSSTAQVGIGNTNPAESSLLDIHTDIIKDKGILIPRVSIDDLSTKAPITTPTIEESLLVYNTNSITGVGFYYWDSSKWVKILDKNGKVNLASDDLLQDAEKRTYDLNGQGLNFTNGSIGINTSNPSKDLEVNSTKNHNAFSFTQSNVLTGEKDVFTIEDQDVGGGSQDESSVLKVHKSGAINSGDNGFSLIELANTGTDPGSDKYWISGRKIDEGAPLWGVDITDNDYWSEGGIKLGVTGVDGGTYTGGNFIVEPDGDTGIGIMVPTARLHVSLNNTATSALFSEITVSNSVWPAALFSNPNTANGFGALGIGFYGVYGLSTNSSAGWAGYFNGDLNVTGSYYNISDERFKQNVKDLSAEYNILNKVLQLKPKSYNWRAKEFPGMAIDPEKKSFGFIAQELAEIFPELVNTDKKIPNPKKASTRDGKNELTEGYYLVNYNGLIPVLTEAIQQQQKIIENQNQRITKLEEIVRNMKK